jgi:hypothetical protein
MTQSSKCASSTSDKGRERDRDTVGRETVRFEQQHEDILSSLVPGTFPNRSEAIRAGVMCLKAAHGISDNEEV